MKTSIIGLLLLIMSAQWSFGQERGSLNPSGRTFTAVEQEVINL